MSIAFYFSTLRFPQEAGLQKGGCRRHGPGPGDQGRPAADGMGGRVVACTERCRGPMQGKPRKSPMGMSVV